MEGHVNGGGGEKVEELVKQLQTELLFTGPGEVRRYTGY